MVKPAISFIMRGKFHPDWRHMVYWHCAYRHSSAMVSNSSGYLGRIAKCQSVNGPHYFFKDDKIHYLF